MINAWFVAARAVHFAACLLILGVFFFDRCIVAPVAKCQGPQIGRHWRTIARWLLFFALPAALASGAAWFALVAIDMSDLPASEALSGGILRTVWRQTQYGALWQIRLGFWIATGLAAIAVVTGRRASSLRAAIAWIGLLSGGMLSVSLAWAGHGQTGRFVRWHLLADVIHLLVSGLWPMGLLPFAWLLIKLRRDRATERWRFISELTCRFSAISLSSVVLLLMTGLVNAWLLVGSISKLFATLYGKVLLVKIAAFGVMVAIGAVNLLYLKPRLASPRAAGPNEERAAARLLFNVSVELVLATVVLAVVGLLGHLVPAVECACQ